MFELLAEGIAEGMAEGARNKKLPKIIRVIFCVVLSTVFLLVMFVCLYGAIVVPSVTVKIILLGISVLAIVYLIKLWKQCYKK